MIPFLAPCVPPRTTAGPRDIRLHLAATVKDVVIQDLRAAPEHSLVLIPHGGEEFCSLEAAFTTFVDPRRAGPRLNVHMLVGAARGPAALCSCQAGSWADGSRGGVDVFPMSPCNLRLSSRRTLHHPAEPPHPAALPLCVRHPWRGGNHLLRCHHDERAGGGRRRSRQ